MCQPSFHTAAGSKARCDGGAAEPDSELGLWQCLGGQPGGDLEEKFIFGICCRRGTFGEWGYAGSDAGLSPVVLSTGLDGNSNRILYYHVILD